LCKRHPFLSELVILNLKQGLARIKRTGRLGKALSGFAVRFLPRQMRAGLYRHHIHCDMAPSSNLVFKLAETREELEACFRLLHDAYVEAGFMQPQSHGLRATLFHALPTTSTLLAKYHNRVIGTVSLIRESNLGFPLQKVFNIEAVRKTGGNIAEVSALAIEKRFRGAMGTVLFPLLKFMYEYATRCFDTRHLLIAVNPRHIDFYEAILFFQRLRQNPVEHYDFANGAPAVGAHLDLASAPEIYRQCYDTFEPDKNLYRYFIKHELPNIHYPEKRFYTTNDPVMTPELLDYFFNQKTQLFASLPPDVVSALHGIYDLEAYQHCLPQLPQQPLLSGEDRRQHRRFFISCPGEVTLAEESGANRAIPITVLECSTFWLRSEVKQPLALDQNCQLNIQLGAQENSRLQTRVTRRATTQRDVYVFQIEQADLAWQKFVSALNKASTHQELEHATRFLEI